MNNHNQPLPALKLLNVESHDIDVWARDPVTRYWFKNISNQIRVLKSRISNVYDRDSIDRTSLRFAETVGQILALSNILHATYKIEEQDTLIAREEDLKELFEDAEDE